MAPRDKPTERNPFSGFHFPWNSPRLQQADIEQGQHSWTNSQPQQPVAEDTLNTAGHDNVERNPPATEGQTFHPITTSRDSSLAIAPDAPRRSNNEQSLNTQSRQGSLSSTNSRRSSLAIAPDVTRVSNGRRTINPPLYHSSPSSLKSRQHSVTFAPNVKRASDGDTVPEMEERQESWPSSSSRKPSVAFAPSLKRGSDGQQIPEMQERQASWQPPRIRKPPVAFSQDIFGSDGGEPSAQPQDWQSPWRSPKSRQAYVGLAPDGHDMGNTEKRGEFDDRHDIWTNRNTRQFSVGVAPDAMGPRKSAEYVRARRHSDVIDFAEKVALGQAHEDQARKHSDIIDFAGNTTPGPHEDDEARDQVKDDVGYFPSTYSVGRRRSSLPEIMLPEMARVVGSNRPMVTRRRSNSLPGMQPGSALPIGPNVADVRNVIFTLSPYRRDTMFESGIRPMATFKGERLIDTPEDDDADDDRKSIVSVDRKSISSLENGWTKVRQKKSSGARPRWKQKLFEYSVYLFLICFIYFVLVGRPLWKGFVWCIWYAMSHLYTIEAGCAIFIAIAFFYSVGSMFMRYEPDPDPVLPGDRRGSIERNASTALLIPCYKSAEMISATVKAALEIFPPENIYVVANGNSPTPLDNTEDVIRPYKVNHIWVPVGSKIVAQFVGVYAAYKFQYVVMIDDDCLLPPNFPLVTDRIQPGNKPGLVKCVGYTIKATGPNSTKGSVVQQLQDLEYKLSGMQRQFAGKWGSATFAHGAIALWERDFVLKCFRHHPGFKISEDWYFGLVARNLGGRIVMCSAVLVETEVPSGLFVGAGARGGFGEMTVYKQRFYRWNFFFLFRLWHDLQHIFFKWRLGVYSVGSKVYTFQEVLETFLYVTCPVLLPIAFIIKPSFIGMMTGVVIAMYFVIVLFFNEVILRKKN